MIRLIEDVENMEWQKVPLEPKWKNVYIEVASNRKIDIAIVNEGQLRKFAETKTPWEEDIDWWENTRELDTEYHLQNREPRFLLLWNANEEEDAIIAYKITPIQ